MKASKKSNHNRQYGQSFLDSFFGNDPYKVNKRNPESKLTIKHDKWDTEDYQSLLKEMKELSVAEDKLTEVVSTGTSAMADTYFSLVKANPKLKDADDVRPSHIVNRAVMGEAMELKEYDELRIHSTTDSVASGLSCIAMEPELEILFDKMKEAQKLAEELEQQMMAMEGMSDGVEDAEAMAAAAMAAGNDGEAKDFQEQAEKIKEQMDKLRKEMQSKAQELDDEIQGKAKEMKEISQKALKDAKDKAEELDGLSSTWGLDQGTLQAMPAQRRIELAAKFNNEKFKRIAQLLGPMQRMALAEQHRKVQYARDEIYDLEQGNNIPNVIPTEMLMLGDPDMDMVWFNRYMEQKLLQYKLRGSEKVAKGGIIWCEDGSGSMGGDPEVWAKAVGLSLYQIAKMQKREFDAYHFGGPGELMTFDFHTGDPATGVDIELKGKPYRVSSDDTGHYETLDGVIKFAETFFGGGPLRLDQRVVTPNGWKPIGDMEVGDTVYGPDGQPTEVVGVYPQGELDDVYEVEFRDGSTVICDGNHIWTVKTPDSDYKDMTLNQILDAGLTMDHRYRFSVPLQSPVDLPSKDFPIHPYLMGYLLGDGTLGDGRSITVHSSEDEHPWASVLPDDTFVTTYFEPTSERCGSYGITGSGNAVREMLDALKAYGIFGLRGAEKFVPNDYLWGSVQERLAVLSGLLDSDGNIVKNGGFEFGNTSYALCEGVQQLAQSLGGVATIRPKKVRENERPCWVVKGRIASSLGAPFMLTRKKDSYVVHQHDYVRSIVAVKPVESADCICIKVNREDGLFLTEGYVVTHNTDFVTPLSAALDKLQDQYERFGAVKGDIVFCTDGICGVPQDWLEMFKEEQSRLGFRVWGILLGWSPAKETEPLATICDKRIFTLNELLSGDGVRGIFRSV